MAKNGIVIDIGFNGVAGINQMIKDIEKELERVNFDEQIGFSKSFDKQIRDVRNNINGLKTELKNITNGLPSDYSNAFSSLNKSVSELKTSFKALETVMTPEQLSKYNNEVRNISKDLDNVGNVAKETSNAINQLGSVQFSNKSKNEINNLKNELNSLEDVAKDIDMDKILQVSDSDKDLSIDKAAKKIEKLYKTINSYSIKNLGLDIEDVKETDEQIEKLANKIRNIDVNSKGFSNFIRDYKTLRGLVDEFGSGSSGEGFDSEKFESFGYNLVDAIKQIQPKIKEEIESINSTINSETANAKAIYLPLDISSDPKELAQRANKIIEKAKGGISPLQVELVLVSKYASRNNQKTLNAIKAQLENVNDEKVKNATLSMIDDFQKKFKDQALELEIKVKAEKAQKEVDRLVKQLQDALNKKFVVNPKISLDGNEAELGELQSELNSISKNLKLNINNIDVTDDDFEENNLLNSITQISNKLTDLFELLLRIKNYSSGIFSSLSSDEIKEFRQSITDFVDSISKEKLTKDAEKNIKTALESISTIIRSETESTETIVEGSLTELLSAFEVFANNAGLSFHDIRIDAEKELDLLESKIKEFINSTQTGVDTIKFDFGNSDKNVQENLEKMLSNRKNNINDSNLSELSDKIDKISKNFRLAFNLDGIEKQFEKVQEAENKIKLTKSGKIDESNANRKNIASWIEEYEKYLKMIRSEASFGNSQNDKIKETRFKESVGDINKVKEIKSVLEEIQTLLTTISTQQVEIKLEDTVINKFEELVNALRDLDKGNKNLANLQKILKTLNDSGFGTNLANLKAPFEELVNSLNGLNLSNSGLDQLNDILSKSKQLEALVLAISSASNNIPSGTGVLSGSMFGGKGNLISESVTTSSKGKTSITQKYDDGTTVKKDASNNISVTKTKAIKKDYEDIIRLEKQKHDLEVRSIKNLGLSETEQVKLNAINVERQNIFARIEEYRKQGLQLDQEETVLNDRIIAQQKEINDLMNPDVSDMRSQYLSSISKFLKEGNSKNLRNTLGRIYNSNNKDDILNNIINNPEDLNNILRRTFPEITSNKKNSEFVNEYKNTYAKLEEIITEIAKSPDIIDDAELNRAKELSSYLEKMILDAKSMSDISIIDPEKSSIPKLYNKLVSLRDKNSGTTRDIKQQLNSLIKSYQPYLDGREMSQSVYNYYSREHLRLSNEIIASGKSGVSMWDKIGERIKLANANFIAMYFSWMDWLRYGREAIQIVTELDTALTELRKVSDASTSELATMFQRASTTAQELGSTVTDVINAQADWSRMGYSLDESDELARVSTIYKNVGDGISQEEANNSLISTLQGFKMTADDSMEIIDKFNEVSNNFAISSGGIGDALQRSASSFTAAHTDLSKAIALTTTAKIMLAEYIEIYIKNTFNCWKTLRALTLQYGGNYHMKV